MFENLYNNSPVIIQNLMCSFKGYLICRKRYNKIFFQQLKKYEDGEYNQQLRLLKFMKNIKEVPFYQKLYKEYNFNINSDDIYKEIRRLPILNKETVKNNIDKIINRSYKGKCDIKKTGGTTGSGLNFPYSFEMENQQWAVWWRYRRWHGINFNTWCGWFGGQHIISIKQRKYPYWRINKPGKQVMFSAYHLNIKTIEYYYNEIIKRQLTWLHGYPSQISLLASNILDKKLLPITTITHITIGSEKLLESQIENIKDVFPKAVIRQHYGLAEGVANISENKDGKFVIDDDFCYIEFIPISDDNPNLCRIIGTGFVNEAFPLVRYDTGDIAEIKISQEGKVNIISIYGRTEEFITLPNGVKFGSAAMSLMFKKITNIKETQIYQKDLFNIELNIIKGNDYTQADENKLIKEIRERITDDVNIKINYVDKIERTISGKLRLVKSEVKQ